MPAELMDFTPGDSAVLVNVPHAGTRLAPGMDDRLTDAARSLADTDWFVDELYDFAPGLGAGLAVATHSRYVIDLNRDPEDTPLYATPGTGLVPETAFDGNALYRDGAGPGDEEKQERLAQYWRPYHAALADELERLRARHGFAVLLDGHSIRSEVPRLFDGVLPDFNLGTWAGRSAAASLAEVAWQVLSTAPGRTHVRDGRFQGGYITRHYGKPSRGVHVLQLEMAQASYMVESPPRRDAGRLEAVQPVLSRLVEVLTRWRPES